MARKCEVTGTKPLVGNHVSHAHNRTKRRQYPNLQTKRIFIPEENRFVTVKLTARALKTVNKNGAKSVLQKAGLL